MTLLTTFNGRLIPSFFHLQCRRVIPSHVLVKMALIHGRLTNLALGRRQHQLILSNSEWQCQFRMLRLLMSDQFMLWYFFVAESAYIKTISYSNGTQFRINDVIEIYICSHTHYCYLPFCWGTIWLCCAISMSAFSKCFSIEIPSHFQQCFEFNKLAALHSEHRIIRTSLTCFDDNVVSTNAGLIVTLLKNHIILLLTRFILFSMF